MSTAPALRRQSIISVTSTTAGPPKGGARSAFIMTSGQTPSRRMSVPSVGAGAVGTVLENTYRTEPEKTFSTGAARRVIREVMEGMLGGKQYDKDTCKQLSTRLADVIQTRVKELRYPRYKLVTNVAIGQANDASVAFASRCVWNGSFDSFAEYTYRNGSLFAVGIVHAVYCD